jgi:N-6 DNA Methylase
VFEPCCGSASFLIGAMGHLRHRLFGMTPRERHAYFVKHLAGVEQEPFGIEISKLALSLADFPNRDGWHVHAGDVFTEGAMTESLRRSGVVFCNPPFEEFDEAQRCRYKLSSVLKPAELLARILADLHPNGALGLVLPRLFVDGRVYAGIREALCRRFAALELTLLPDKAFENADAEVVLLVASEPIPHNTTRVLVRRVNGDRTSWRSFEQRHEVSWECSATLTPSQSRITLLLPELPNLWKSLEGYKQLHQVVEKISRGIRWKKPMTKDHKETGYRQKYERNDEAPGFIQGVSTNTKFHMFEVPPLKYLSVRQEDRATDAWQLAWGRPKVIFGKSARSRGHWRLAAFPDSIGVACYQTYIAIWSRADGYDEVVLSAILNAPVANAFISTREGKTDITIDTLRAIPMPILTAAEQNRIRELVARYQIAIDRSNLDEVAVVEDPERLLKQIDAVVLDGYKLPPHVEVELLEFFRGHKRPTAHPFGEYMPKDCGFTFPLSRILSPNYGGLTAKELLSRIG